MLQSASPPLVEEAWPAKKRARAPRSGRDGQVGHRPRQEREGPRSPLSLRETYPIPPTPGERRSQAVTETGVVSLRPPGRRISSIYKSLSLLHSLTHASRHSHARHPSASRTRQRCITLIRSRGYPRSGSFPTCVCGAGSVNRHPARQWHGHSRRPHRRHCLPRIQRRVVPLHRTEAADIASSSSLPSSAT